MALEKQNLSISLSKGLDTKSDPKQVVAGKLLLLQNATFQSLGRFKKRAGFSVLNSSLSLGNAIASYNDELVVLDGAGVYSYGEQLQDLTLKGRKTACDISVDSIVRNSYQQTQPDSALLNGMMCFAYYDSSGKTLYSVLDQVTKKVYISGAQVGTAATSPKVLAIGTKFAVFFVEGGTTLKILTIDSASPSNTSLVTVATLGTSNQYYDAALINGAIVCAYTNASNTTSLRSISSSFTLGTPLVYAALTLQKCLFADPINQVILGYNTGTSAAYVICSAALSSVSGATVVETISGIQNITGIYNTSGPLFYYEMLNSTGSVSDNYVRICQVSAGAPYPSELLRSVGLWSKPFKYSGTIYIALAHQSTLQSCYFIVDTNGIVISRIASENGGDLSSNGLLRQVNSLTSASFQLAYLIKDFVTSLNGSVFTQTGINSVALNFGGGIATQGIGNNLNLSGALISTYDGQSVTEKGFHLYPEGFTAVAAPNGGGLSTGSYQYTALYEWTDNKGQVHQSADGVPLKLDTSFNKLYIPGSVNGTTFNPSDSNDGARLAPGMTVTGPGVAAGTFLQYYAGGMGFSQSTTGSGTFVFTAGKEFQGNTTIGSAVVSLTRQFTEYYPISYVSGSNIMTLNSDDKLRVNTYFGNLGYVVSQVGRSVTMSVAAPSTRSNVYGSAFAFFSATATVGSNILTSVTPIDGIVPGDLVQFGNAPSGYSTVLSVSGSSITIDYTIPAGGGGPNSYFLGLPLRYPAVGEVFNDPSGAIGSASIKELGSGTVTLNTVAGSSGTRLSFNSVAAITGNLKLPTLRVTDKAGVSIAVYRTLVNQSTFYRVSSLTSPLISSKSVDSITFADTVPDSVLLGNEQLYTTGDVVYNLPPPPASISWTYKNRAMMVPSENTRQVWYSKPAVPGVAVEFSDQFILNVPEEGGPITAGAQLDDKDIIFKRGSIFVHVGDGPANTGAQNDFGDPQKIASDSGCINQKSIVLIPTGLMYQSEKGIYLLDRSLNVTYIGKDVEAYNTSTITSARLIRDLNQVRYSLAGSNTTLVFDYLIGEWSVFTNPEVKDAATYKNLYAYIAPSGKVYIETPGVFLDDTAPILMSLTTSWLSFAGLQGFQRLYKMLLLGEYKSPHSLTLNIAYDFKSAYNQTVTIPVTSAPVGAYQYRVDFKIQKCEAIQITLSENQTAPYGEGVSLSAFALEVGAKKGLNKVSASKSYG